MINWRLIVKLMILDLKKKNEDFYIESAIRSQYIKTLKFESIIQRLINDVYKFF